MGVNRTIQLLRRQISRNLPMNLPLEMINECRKNKIVREFGFIEVFSPLFLYFTKTFDSAFWRTNTTLRDTKFLHRRWNKIIHSDNWQENTSCMQRPSKNVGFGSYPGKFGLMCGPHNECVCSMQRETGPLGNFNHSQNVEIYYV